MENEIRAPHAGTVMSISVEVGDRVELGSDLLSSDDDGRLVPTVTRTGGP